MKSEAGTGIEKCEKWKLGSVSLPLDVKLVAGTINMFQSRRWPWWS